MIEDSLASVESASIDDERRMKRVFVPFLYATIATVLPALVAMVLSFGVYWATTLNLLVLLGLCFGCLGLIRFGWLRLSFQVFFFSGLLYVTGLTLLFGGIEGANSVGYLLLACLVGMSRGWRCGAISIVFCSVLAVSVYFLQKHQIVTPQVLPFQAEAGLMTIIGGIGLGWDDVVSRAQTTRRSAGACETRTPRAQGDGSSLATCQ